MNILIPVDIEEDCRLALADYFEAYCRPLPKEYGDCILVQCTGGSSKNTIDTFTVVLDARAKTDAAAVELLRNALGVLTEQANSGFRSLRNVTINSLARWGSDPVRPDWKLCTATVLVVAHREAATISES